MSAAVGDSSVEPPKPVDACTYLEGQLLFHPNKVLVRRVFFLDPEKTKYISVGFYPTRNYKPLVEIGSPKSFYKVMDGEFAMHSASPFNTAILTLGKKKHRKSMFIKLNDLRYLAYIFPLVENQLLKYNEAISDVMNYVLTKLNSTSYVEPSANASKNILYYQLYEEMKTLL